VDPVFGPTLALVLALALGIGLALGLLGGGGSLLTVPLLVYVAGLAAKPAIATSLAVVAVTSAVALALHARAGNVRWRTGAVFAPAGMAGAFAGGWLGRLVPGEILLLLFAAMLVTTAVAMLRPRPVVAEGGSSRRSLSSGWSVAWIALQGAAVGLATGLVGAGGGFLVVPVLALLGGLPMRAAVGTSLLVVALQAGAGFAGYVSHVAVPWDLAGAVTGAAVVGSLGGATLAARVPPEGLRRGFAVLVLAIAALVVWREAPALLAGAGGADGPRGALSAPAASAAAPLLLNDLAPLPWWGAGAGIAAITLILLAGLGTRLGISSGLEDVCSAALRTPYFRRETVVRGRRWRLPFLAGLVAGGALSAATGGGWAPFWDLGRFDATFGWGPAAKLAWMFAGGLLIGVGTRMAGGCTSGHGIFGVSSGERSGLLATASFLAAGTLASHGIYRVLAPLLANGTPVPGGS